MTKLTTEARSSPRPPPYFDALLFRIAQGDRVAETAFGRHVHWGYWDEPTAADGSADDFSRASDRLYEVVLDAAQLSDGLAVVDVGCGFGGTIAKANGRYSDMKLIGVNLDQRQIDRAARDVCAQPDNEVRFVAAEASNLPCADKSIDVVLAVEAIFHFHRPSFFTEVNRVLRSGGRLVVTDFTPRRSRKWLFIALNRIFRRRTEITFGPIDINWTVADYRRLTERTGLLLDRQVDITRHTLPSYRFVRALMRTWDDAVQAMAFDQSTALLEVASRLGILRYSMLRFSKP